ncbi:MAG: carbohydrate binding domain-containing protein [Phycisphaerales bacterium]|nr:MAG: carbohydrate binding domain-containing protein [Phycisphaerales bacterium]
MFRRMKWFVAVLLVLGICSEATLGELIGYWTFEEGQGTQTADVTGNGNDGTFNGDVEWVPGYAGTAVGFDTAGERIVIGPLDPSAENNAMTLAAWIKWEGQDHSISQQGIIGKRLGWDPGTNIKWFWQTNPAGDLLFRADAGDGGTGLWWGNAALVPYANEWTHVALTWDNGAAVQYINGQEVSTGNVTFRDTADETPMTIGCVDSTNNETFVGSIDEVRIYDNALSAGEIQIAMLPGAGPAFATSPIPEAGTTNVPQDVVLSWTPAESAVAHDVYFGESFDDVNVAPTPNTLDLLKSDNQPGTTFDPEGLLEFGKTYFWRIDEVNAPPDSTVTKGPVWSFTVEEFAYPVTRVTATASSENAADMGAGKTVDGSGLDGDLHSQEPEDMWLSSPTGDQPTWIQFEFDQAYELYEMWVWNQNQVVEPLIGFGAKDVTIEHSVDGANWTTLGDVEIARAPGVADNPPDSKIDLSGVYAQHVRLTINSNWTGILQQFGLSEVRFFFVPVKASDPAPVVGGSEVPLDVTLDWRGGREAVTHEVYLSKDEGEVIDGTALVGAVSETRFQPDTLEYGQIYYWKVNEVNNNAAVPVREGDVWEFSTVENLIVDDFEGYTDDDLAGEAIWQTWIDGFENPQNGSQVGYLVPPYAERTIVNSGRQSMPLFYNNNQGTARYSETERTFDQTQDWTTGGISQLSVWFRGHAGSVGSFVEGPVGTFTMTGSGADITGPADEFHYAYKTLTGPGTIIARINSIQNTHNWAKAGVMIRETLEPGSAHATAFVTPAEGVVYEYRMDTGSDNVGAASRETGITAPHWVKLERNISGVFTASHSADGSNWQALGTNATANIQMGSTVHIGLALTSHDASLTCEAVFSNVTTTGNISGQWVNQDIGIASNDPEPVYIGLADSAGRTGIVVHEDPAAAQFDTFTLWAVGLADFADQGVNVSAVRKIILGAGDREATVPGGSGTLYFDDIAVGNPVLRSEPVNLLTNGGFETGDPAPWSGGGAVGSVMTVVDTLAGAEIAEDPIEGNYCLHIAVGEKGTNTWDSQLKYFDLVFEQGKVYTLSAFIKSDDEVQIRLNPQLSQAPYTSYGAQVFTVTKEWQEYYITTPPMTETVDPANIDFHFNFDVGEFWIDDIKFYEGEYYSPPPSGAIVLGDFEGDLDGWWERDATLSFSATGATLGAQALQVDGPGDWHINALLDLKPHRVALGQAGATITADVTVFDADLTTTWMNIEMVINGQNNDDAGPNNNIGWQSLGAQSVTRDGQPNTYSWVIPDELTSAIAAVDDNIWWFELALVTNLDAASVTKFYVDNIQLVITAP